MSVTALHWHNTFGTVIFIKFFFCFCQYLKARASKKIMRGTQSINSTYRACYANNNFINCLIEVLAIYITKSTRVDYVYAIINEFRFLHLICEKRQPQQLLLFNTNRQLKLMVSCMGAIAYYSAYDKSSCILLRQLLYKNDSQCRLMNYRGQIWSIKTLYIRSKLYQY